MILLLLLLKSGVWQTVQAKPLPGHSLAHNHDKVTEPGYWKCV